MGLPFRLRLRIVAIAAILETAALVHLAHGAPVPTVAPAEAAAFEGQAAVRVAGLASHVRAAADGSLTLQVEAGRHALAVRTRGPATASQGAWVEAEGRITRFAGVLTLWVDKPDGLRVTAGPDPAEPSWGQVANDPAAWHGVRIRLAGLVDRGTLGDREGHRIQLGDGAWPKSGAVQAVGVVAYHPPCLCERFTATSVHVVATA